MGRIAGEIQIARPPEVVFDLVADERNRYDPRVREAELLTDGPIGTGTRFRSVAGTARRPVEMIVEITGYDRPRRLASTTRTKGMEIDSTLVFEPTLNGTRMCWSSHLRPRGLFRLLAPVLALVGRRQMRRVWGALRSHLEGQSGPPEAPAGIATAVAADAVDLYWLPLGAGDHVVKRCGRIYEGLVAAREHRDRCDIYHAALEVYLDGDRYVIESAPAWDRAEPDRGVVAEGAVGLAQLGRWKWFRYEVRRWRNGLIPDAAEAVDSPRRIAEDRHRATQVLDLAPQFPALTWGRDEQHLGDMWNSNSLIAWLLARSGLDMDAIRPPARGRAPGWAAGVIAAGRVTTPDVAATPPTDETTSGRPDGAAARVALG